MSHPKWSYNLSVGLPDIDEQHKELFTISKELYSAIEQGQGNEMLQDTFRKLGVYVQNHFSAEEAYMRSLGYPDLEAHKKEHEQLVLRYKMLWNLKQHNQPVRAEGVAYFLSEWITEHITNSDSKIGEFARSKS